MILKEGGLQLRLQKGVKEKGIENDQTDRQIDRQDALIVMMVSVNSASRLLLNFTGGILVKMYTIIALASRMGGTD